MRVVGAARAKHARDQRVAIDVARPRFRERACQPEQHRPARQRQPLVTGAQTTTARVDDQRARREQRFDLVETQRLLIAGVQAPRRRTIERSARLGHLGHERGHLRTFSRFVRARQRRLRRCGAQRAQRHFGRRQLGHCCKRRWKLVPVDARQRGCGLVDAAEQQQPAHRDQTCVRRVGAIGVRLERGRSRSQRARRAAQIAHRERHLRLCDDAARTRQLLVRTEAARGAPQQLASARVLAELRHRDAAQRERRRIVAQRDALQRAERVTDHERARGGGDQGVHRERLQRGASPPRWSALNLRSAA